MIKAIQRKIPGSPILLIFMHRLEIIVQLCNQIRHYIRKTTNNSSDELRLVIWATKDCRSEIDLQISQVGKFND